MRYPFALLLMTVGVGLLGCDPGSIDGYVPPDPDDPLDNVDERLACSAELSVTGSLAPEGGTAPAADAGCVPNGTWTVNLTLTDQGDCETVPFNPTYIYSVTGDNELGFTYTWNDDPTNENTFLKVTAAGGTCLGSFEHYSADAKGLLLIKPAEDDLVLTGKAYYELYNEPQL